MTGTDVQIRAVQALEAGQLHHLTFRALRELLNRIDGKRIVAVAAWQDERPLGLALLGPNLLGKPGAQLHSIMVSFPHRRQGLGRQLLASMVTLAGEMGAGDLVAEWSSRLPGAGALAGLLHHAGWTEPQRVCLRLQSSVDRTERVFLRRAALLGRLERDQVTLVPWGTLGQGGQQRVMDVVAALRGAGELPDWADPSSHLTTAEPHFTLMIRDGTGAWRGWIICEYQPLVDRWFFPIGWVHPADAKRGWLMAAIAKVTAMMEAQIGPHAVAAFEASHLNPPMWAMLEKHFFPHATMADYLLSSRLVNSGCSLPPVPGPTGASCPTVC
jgi:GNAT superfamily N-acetyltransferase